MVVISLTKKIGHLKENVINPGKLHLNKMMVKRHAICLIL